MHRLEMTQKWREVKVFISSTFSDMHSERDHLVKRVFPQLRERLLPYRIHLEDIDLRWGITEDEAKSDRALDLCLQQIDECRPFFVGILGERYGWVPKTFSEQALSKYGWIQHLAGKSITELEILYGVLSKPEMRTHAFFYFRDPAFIDDVPSTHRAAVCSEDAEAEQKLRDLKDAIRAAHLPTPPMEDYPCSYAGLRVNWRLVSQQLDPARRAALESVAREGVVDVGEYGRLDEGLRTEIDNVGTVLLDGLDPFGAHVFDHLWQGIKAEYGLPDEPPAYPDDPLAEEQNFHERFMESRTRIYVGRQKYLARLTEIADAETSRLCVVTGPGGMGKSALMARFATTYTEHNPDVLVVPHFIGASPSSTSLRGTLDRFCRILKHHFAFGAEIEDDVNKLATQFGEFVSRAGKEHASSRVLFVIDALNQMDDTDSAHTLFWLPRELPGNVKVTVSCIDEPGKPEAMLLALANWDMVRIPLEPLTDHERFEIVTEMPSLSARKLDPAQVQLLLDNPATKNPLFLLVALEELRGFGSFALLNAQIIALPHGEDAVTELFLQVIERLELEFDAGTVRAVLSLLASARRGLSETELLVIVEGHADLSRSTSDLFPILRQVRAYLQYRGDMLDFFHRNFFKAVHARYLDTEERKREAHATLSRYFASRWQEPCLHALQELPYHQTKAERWDDLIGTAETPGTLCNLLFIEAKCEAGLFHELAGDYNQALEDLPEFREENERNRQYGEAMRRYNQALREYAVRRYDWWERHERGENAPEPEYPARPPELDADTETTIPEEESGRAVRIRRLSNFVNGLLSFLPMHSGLVLLLAANDGEESPVAEAAETVLNARNQLWLRRSPRMPSPPLRPQCLRTLLGHSSAIKSVSVTPDGRRAVSVSGLNLNEENAVRTWDLDTGACLRTLAWGWDCLRISVSLDGRRAVSLERGSKPRVWDIETGMCLRTLEGHTDNIRSVSVSPDGRRAVLKTGRGGTLQVWDIEKGVCLHTFEGHTDNIRSVSVSPDGRRAVLETGRGGTLQVWDIEKGVCLRTFEGHTEVIWLPDGRRAMSENEGTLMVWDLETGAYLRSLKGYARIHCADAGPDGRVLSYGYTTEQGAGAALRVWDLETGTCLRTIEWDIISSSIGSVSVLPDGRRAVLVDRDNNLQVWDLEKGECLRMLEGHTDRVSSVSVSPDGRRAISGSWDRTLRVWDIGTGAGLRTLKGDTHWVTSVSVCPGGRCAVSSGDCDKTLRVWDLETGACLRTLEGHTHWVTSVSVSPDGRRAVSVSQDHTLRVWDLDTGACLCTLEGHTDAVSSVSVSPDGRRAVSVSQDHTLRVWDLDTGTCLHTIREHASGVTSVSVLPDGRSAVLGGQHGALSVWDLEVGTRLRMPHLCIDQVWRVLSDGRRVISRGAHEYLHVWDLKTGTSLRRIGRHCEDIRTMCVFPDGRRAVSGCWEKRKWFGSVRALPGSRDKTLRVWDLETAGCLAVYHAGANVLCVAVSPKGDRIVCGTIDGQMHFLTPVNFPPPGPAILTATSAQTARCPLCAREFAPGAEVAGAVQAHMAALGPGQSPCLELPREAFEDPRLVSTCPHCGGAIKFNPFFVVR